MHVPAPDWVIRAHVPTPDWVISVHVPKCRGCADVRELLHVEGAFLCTCMYLVVLGQSLVRQAGRLTLTSSFILLQLVMVITVEFWYIFKYGKNKNQAEL